MKSQNKHALFFILIVLVAIGILGSFYYFIFIHERVSHVKLKTASKIVNFDGGGKTDISVYRSRTGGWWIMPSSGRAPYSKGWGGDPSDKPVPGDYDGDGKTDIAIYRGTTGIWSIIPSSGGQPISKGWGGDPSDIAVTLNPTSVY